MTRAEKDAYIHCWNVVGFLMGIREELLPANYEESEKLYQRSGRIKAARRRRTGADGGAHEPARTFDAPRACATCR